MISGAADMMCDQLNFGLLNLSAESPSPSLSISDNNLTVSCSANVKSNAVVESAARSLSPTSIRSGSHTDIGSRTLNEDQHIMIDDLKAFLQADQALADECSVSDYCGTTALTVLIMGRHVIIANTGDCRAVLCRNGSAAQITQDHRGSTCLQEKERCERLGGYFDGEGYLNGQLGVTRALGDRYMKKEKMLIAEPDVRQMVLTDNDEFMIVACDGIWDVMSNQEAVALVRCQLRQHNDPQRCAKELVNQALRLHSTDNLTAIVHTWVNMVLS
ncbi:hypothetical protein M8C21_007993 [Ambrosia artemisiifolia]|uniref:PPM-type phosphatase domain-containing protein n=1 Tax=Ambrosia artemisiifolia TaxID=4212 RepID=A0AAD5CU32_AMBAR|nr:hypothetical protein M8C21_007993 [Ambrosia artemisiifolia]